LDLLRKNRRAPILAIEEEPIDPRSHAQGASELSLCLEAELAQISAAQEEVFRLHALAGFTHEEIAELRGCRVATSRALLKQARTSLRESKRFREFGL
jgi:RNA polymerase sigma factor (sigma-70 family)